MHVDLLTTSLHPYGDGGRGSTSNNNFKTNHMGFSYMVNNLETAIFHEQAGFPNYTPQGAPRVPQQEPPHRLQGKHSVSTTQIWPNHALEDPWYVLEPPISFWARSSSPERSSLDYNNTRTGNQSTNLLVHSWHCGACLLLVPMVHCCKCTSPTQISYGVVPIMKRSAANPYAPSTTREDPSLLSTHHFIGQY